MKKSYHSMYVVDVKITPDFIELTDSSRMSYYMSFENKALIEKFKIWFSDVFSAGVQSYLLVCEYHEMLKAGEVVLIIDDLLHYKHDE